MSVNHIKNFLYHSLSKENLKILEEAIGNNGSNFTKTEYGLQITVAEINLSCFSTVPQPRLLSEGKDSHLVVIKRPEGLEYIEESYD